MQAADYALNDDFGRWQELRHWNLKYWAMEALAYAADGDDVTAALGATYCAEIGRRADKAARDRFLRKAVQIVNT